MGTDRGGKMYPYYSRYDDHYRELYAQGIRYILINGCLVIDDGRMTDRLPGKVLRHGRQE